MKSQKGFLAGCVLIINLVLIIKLVSAHSKDDKKIKQSTLTTSRNAKQDNKDLYYFKHPYLSRAHQLNEARKYDSAIIYYKEAATKFEHESQWQSYVWVTSYIGKLYLRVSGEDYKKALPYLQKAHNTAEKKLDKNDPCMALTQYYLGNYYNKDSQPDTSLKYYNSALQILLKNYGEINLYTSDLHEALGELYAKSFFNNMVAESHYLKSVTIKEGLADKVKDSVLTNSYYELVKFYMMAGDFEKAQTYCYKAIDFTPYLKNHKLAWMELLEQVLADIYSEQKNYPMAIQKLKNAIRINNENKEGDKGYLSYHYQSLGELYNAKLNYDSAIMFYNKSLELTKDTSIFEDQIQRSCDVRFALGTTFFKLKKYTTALSYLRNCLNTRLAIYGRKHNETAIAFEAVGNVYQEMGLEDTALKYFRGGILASSRIFADTGLFTVPLASDLNKNYYSFGIVKGNAAALKQLYESDTNNTRALFAAMAYYCLADTLITMYGSEYDRETTQLLFAKDNTSIYEEAIDCATDLYNKTADLKYHNLVFNFMDKQKSALLLHALNETDALKQSGINKNDQQSYRALRHERAFLQSSLEEVNKDEIQDDKILKMLHNRIYQTEANIRQLQKRFKSGHPYFDAGNITDSIRLKDVQLFSGSNNSLVVEYFWGNKAVYAIGVYKGISKLLRLENKAELEVAFDTLKWCFNNGYVPATRDQDFNSFQNSSFNLYNFLLKPMLSAFNALDCKVRPNIVVIPDGLLSYVPFEAMITSTANDKNADYRKLNYLVKSFNVSYDYSARLLLKKHPQEQREESCRVLGLSYSKDTVADSRSGQLSSLRSFSGSELPGSAKELKAISSYMNGEYYMGDMATKSVFEKEATDFDILHLALHGQADEKKSYGSRLVFKKGKDIVDDESLYAYEINNMPVKAKLAVLSACESGIGKVNPGEGIFSIARGFIHAGCPAVVMSLWKVNDDLTAGIIGDFYKELSAGDSIDQSLRKAKLEYLARADRRSAHPSYWAAFVAMGKMEPVVNKQKENNKILFGFVAIVVVSAGTYVISKLRRAA